VNQQQEEQLAPAQPLKQPLQMAQETVFSRVEEAAATAGADSQALDAREQRLQNEEQQLAADRADVEKREQALQTEEATEREEEATLASRNAALEEKEKQVSHLQSEVVQEQQKMWMILNKEGLDKQMMTQQSPPATDQPVSSLAATGKRRNGHSHRKAAVLAQMSSKAAVAAAARSRSATAARYPGHSDLQLVVAAKMAASKSDDEDGEPAPMDDDEQQPGMSEEDANGQFADNDDIAS